MIGALIIHLAQARESYSTQFVCVCLLSTSRSKGLDYRLNICRLYATIPRLQISIEILRSRDIALFMVICRFTAIQTPGSVCYLWFGCSAMHVNTLVTNEVF